MRDDCNGEGQHEERKTATVEANGRVAQLLHARVDLSFDLSSDRLIEALLAVTGDQLRA